jgi:cell division protein FtsQ
MVKKRIIINILLAVFWTAMGTGTIVLLVAAIRIKDSKKCTGVDVNIKGVSNNFFVDKADILSVILSGPNGNVLDRAVSSFDLQSIESELEKSIWVKKTQLYFDNNERLQVIVLEREPVARVFSSFGTTFYVDKDLSMLPLSEKFSARLPVFTNFPSDKKVLLPSDSSLLRDIVSISLAIQKDSFQMAMIEQIDITDQRSFEMLPKLGNTTIILGDAKNIDNKLSKLRLFYKSVLVKAGWNMYSEINIQYNNQVVAKRKGADDVKADSLRTLQLIQLISENAQRLSEDSFQTMMQDTEKNSANGSIIQQSLERDENIDFVEMTAGLPAEIAIVNKKAGLLVDSKIVGKSETVVKQSLVIKSMDKEDKQKLGAPEKLKAEQPKALLKKQKN